MWLMVMQRLHGGVSLEAAVLELLRGLPASFWPKPCRRIRDWHERGKAPSSNTGAYNQARQGLPLSVVEQSCDRIFEGLLAQMKHRRSGQIDAFLLDGSCIRTAHSAALCRKYPPGRNQYGKGHWPILRVLVAHDLYTGLAMRPEWGAVHGAHAVSEQELLERALRRLPSGSTIIGDANFGVFSVAYAGVQSGHPILLRLSRPRALRLAGKALRHGIDRTVIWQPSAEDRRRHPDLPQSACVTGRLIVRKVQPDNGGTPFLLALFTTQSDPPADIFRLYGRRWSIETDVRTLKSTLRLDQLTCWTPDMVAKEMDLGITAYNLVRAVTALASEQSGVPPRGYSFSKVRRIVEMSASMLADAPDPRTAKRLFDQMMQWVQQSKLPHRKKKRRSYPRQVWSRGDSFPPRKT